MDKAAGCKVAGYKVVYESKDDRLCSLARHMDKDGVEYAEGRTTYPKEGCGPLCTFEDGEDAIILVEYNPKHKVHLHECEYEPSNERKVWCHTYDPTSVEDRSLRSLRMSYPGTVLAKSVTLGKRIASSMAGK